MKKKIIIILTVILVLFAVGCAVAYNYIKEYQNRLTPPTLPEENIQEEVVIEEPKEPEYKDENPVKLGLYIERGNTLELITDTYYCNWAPENVLGLFFAVPSDEATLSSNNFDTMWKEKIQAYPNSENIRIGYAIDFKYENENIHYQVCNPDDAYLTFPKIMSYLYDDVNLVPGKTYYHITQDDMYDYTICSSFKLVGDVDTENISSDIKLTVFSWDTEDDFDPETGNYRGQSTYTITISK